MWAGSGFGMRQNFHRVGGAFLVAVLLVCGLAGATAAAADPRLEQAEREAQERLAQVDEILQEIERLDIRSTEVETRLADLYRQSEEYEAQADEADTASSQQVRQLYIHGSSDPGLTILVSDTPEQAAEQARLLQILAQRNRGTFENVAGALVDNRLQAEEVERGIGDLEQRQEELGRAREDAQRTAEEALAAVERVREQIAAEEEARRRAEEEQRRRAEAAAAAARADEAEDEETPDDSEPAPAPGGGGGAAPVAGGVACPVGQPRNYSDTYGAPRSGGRTHKGTDILAPMNTPIYAIEDGTVTRMNSNTLGGISLYLQGDSGNLYYYTHLNGYVGGISAGQRVTAGQHIAANGMTGNAPVPHLHFEVMPGGGGNVNPYPYVVEACG